jgi:D-alanine-D-alanine ligase
MRVLVLLGGDSNEREVSLRSGAAVRDALTDGGHDVQIFDPQQGYEGLKDFVGKVDFVFPILHGKGGEDGTVQAELEKSGFKYLGADSRVSRFCFDKVAFKKLLNKLSILVPKGEVVTKDSILNSGLIKKPYVLKPIDGGSTIDAFIIRNPKTNSYNPKVFNKYGKMLLEELIIGSEITVPVLGDTALPVIEIIPPDGKEFDYENKYNGATAEICPPKTVFEDKQKEAQEIAEKVHNAAGVRHLSRTDIIIDKDGKLWVLELNTMPGMTAQSLFPKSAAVVGITMPQLVNKFVELTLTP